MNGKCRRVKGCWSRGITRGSMFFNDNIIRFIVFLDVFSTKMVTKKKLGKQHFKTLQAAINTAKNAISYREKKKAKVINYKGNKYVIPQNKSLKDII